MTVGTTYLYGDSTPAPLEMDFIAFLREVFDCGAKVLQCDARIVETLQRVDALSEATERDIESAETLAAEVAESLDMADVGDRDSIAARCAARIRQSIHDLVFAEAEAARAAVTSGKTRAAQTATIEREACFKALEGLLLRHSLPESVTSTRVRIEAGSRYDAQLGGVAPYGLEWKLSLAIPEAHPMASILRVERIVARLEIEAPEEAGWLHKEVKIRRQRLDRLYVSELSLDPAQTTIKLRAMPDGTGSGFDLNHRHETGRMQLSRVSEAGATAESPYDVHGEDAARLRDFEKALVGMIQELAGHKRALMRASLDGTAIQQIDSPRVLVDRIIANIAPKVHEISRHSLAQGELVVKRLLSDNRREEIFVSTSELEEKLRSLPPPARSAFDPLGLWPRRPSLRASSPTEGRAPKETESSWKVPAAPRVPVQTPAPEASVIVQPVVVMSSERSASQPAAGAPASPPSGRPSQPPRN